MKKTALLIPLVLGAAVAGYYFSEKKPSTDLEKASTTGVEQTEKSASFTKVTSTRPAPVSLEGLSEFQKSDVIARLRAALAAQDGDAIGIAYRDLIAFFEAHPERVADYVSLMQTEKNEHVLRMFTLALAASESGLTANEEIIKTAMQLAKDGSFEQRQHIMLHLMSSFEMRDDVFESVLDLSRNDPNSQVKTSGVVVMADWMDRFPEKAGVLLENIGEIFKTAQDEDVRVFTYQVLSLHKEQLTREMHLLLQERLATELDSYTGNIIASALFAAPDDIRSEALTKVQASFNTEADEERKRNLLAQMVCLSRGDLTPLLKQISSGETPIAQDARDYLAIVSNGGPFEPNDILNQKAIRDGNHTSCDHPDHKH